MDIDTISSVWDDLEFLTVEEALANADWLAERIAEEISKPAAYDEFFNTENVNSDVVGFKLDVPPRLNRKADHVAAGGEIPVAGVTKDDYDGFVKIRKRALGLRVHWEEKEDNRINAVRDRFQAQVETTREQNSEEAYATLEAADIQRHSILTPWNDNGNVAQDLVDMRALIKGAKDEKGNKFRYRPTFIIVNPVVTDSIITNETILKYYTGNMADKNPMLNGEPDLRVFGNMRIIEDEAVPEEDLWMGSQKKAGFMAQREAAWASPFLPEDGTDARGGSHQSFRSNWSHRRGFGVNRPLAVVKAEGVFR